MGEAQYAILARFETEDDAIRGAQAMRNFIRRETQAADTLMDMGGTTQVDFGEDECWLDVMLDKREKTVGYSAIVWHCTSWEPLAEAMRQVGGTCEWVSEEDYDIFDVLRWKTHGASRQG